MISAAAVSLCRFLRKDDADDAIDGMDGKDYLVRSYGKMLGR